ncbi:MAG: alpha/beta hydrolase [Anaerolineales bacterium]|nr:alpha/beta hydrolase [Anaerolineales bacterium]
MHSKNADRARPPLIFIHGAGGSLLTFHPELRRLQNETIYALDLPAHGESAGEGRTSVEAYADNVLDFMKSMDIDSAVVCGHSMGGAIALTLALKNPQTVRALALLGGGAKLRVAQSILDLLEDPAMFKSAVERINRACFSAAASPDLVALSQRNMERVAPSVLSGDFRACNLFDATTRLAEINCPTLILCGADDRMTPPKHSQYLKENLPDSQFHLLENCGHLLTLEQPQEVARLLKKFLEEIYE